MEKRTRRVALFLLACLAARAASAFTDGMLPNGDFEEGPDKSQLINGTVVTGRDVIPHWETSGYVEYIESGQKQADMMLVVPSGARAVRLGNEASVEQRLNVTPGMYYSITFSAARTCAQAEKLNVSVGGECGVIPIQTVYTSSGWDSYAWAFRAKVCEVVLVLHNPGYEEDAACGPIIDFVAMKTLYPPQHTENNMLMNGDFEEGPYMLPNSSWGVLLPPNTEDAHSPLPAWQIMSTNKVVEYVDAAHHAVPHGARAVELVAGAETALVQEVVGTEPGLSYRLEFSVGDAADGCEGELAVEAYAARGRTRVQYWSSGSGWSTRGVLVFTAIANRTRVVFVSPSYQTKKDGTLCGPVVDDASLVSVHAPPAARRLLL